MDVQPVRQARMVLRAEHRRVTLTRRFESIARLQRSRCSTALVLGHKRQQHLIGVAF